MIFITYLNVSVKELLSNFVEMQLLFYVCLFSVNFLFQNDYRFTGNCKNRTESHELLFTHFPNDSILYNCSTISKPGN